MDLDYTVTHKLVIQREVRAMGGTSWETAVGLGASINSDLPNALEAANHRLRSVMEKDKERPYPNRFTGRYRVVSRTTAITEVSITEMEIDQ